MDKKTQDKTKEEIMKELGLENLPKKKQDDILVKMGELILKKIFIETVDRLSGTDRKTFEEMLKGGNKTEDIEIFLNERIDDYDKMVEGIITELKEEMKKSSN
jgi:hypothetical protein